jgi:hypothetical protein
MNEAAKIDSFGISIPLGKTSLTKDQLTNLIIDKSSGELLKESPKSINDLNNGIKTLISLKTYEGLKYHKGDFLKIGINAKQLGSDYFQGINSDNINKILSYLNNRFGLGISLKDLLRSKVGDIDICKDSTLCEASDMYLLVKQIYDLSKQIGLNSNNVRKFRNKFVTWTGIEYSKRDKSNSENPHVKYYHKGYDLNFESSEFAKAYLKNVNYDKIVRIECNVRTDEIKKYFGDRTLMSVLSNGDKEKIFHSKLSVYFGDKEKLSRTTHLMDKSQLSSKEKRTLGILLLLDKMKAPLTKDEIIKELTKVYSENKDKSSRIRYKKEISKMYDLFINLPHQSSIKRLYSLLGLND